MPDAHSVVEKEHKSIFLNEHFMAATCVFVVVTGLATSYFYFVENDIFGVFGLLAKLVTAVAMFFAFKFFKWDAAKGFMGGVLFSLMYQEGYLALDRLLGEQNFETYLMVGVQGSLYLSAASMTFCMTIIITINHFMIDYMQRSDMKNVIFNRIAIGFKLAAYVLLIVANSQLGLSSSIVWENALQNLSDAALLVLFISVESQLDSFRVMRREMQAERRKRR